MSNNKQTSADWLFQQLWETPKDKFTWYSILEQAKDMEKEQIIEAYKYGNQSDVYFKPEQYYNETFKSE